MKLKELQQAHDKAAGGNWAYFGESKCGRLKIEVEHPPEKRDKRTEEADEIPSMCSLVKAAVAEHGYIQQCWFCKASNQIHPTDGPDPVLPSSSQPEQGWGGAGRSQPADLPALGLGP